MCATFAEFTVDQVDAAIEHVARHGAENRATPVHYTLVFAAGGLPAPQLLHQGGETQQVTLFMEAFHHRCQELGYPPLDSLVVHVAGDRGGVPGAGYFRINNIPDPYGRGASVEDEVAGGRFLEAQRAECG
jgi:hypothetical protein